MSDTHYGTYAEYKGYTTPLVRDKHIRRLNAEFWAPMACTTEMSVLEIGCGTGLFLAYLSARGVENFTGIDSDPALQGVIPEPVAGRFRVAEAAGGDQQHALGLAMAAGDPAFQPVQRINNADQFCHSLDTRRSIGGVGFLFD